VFAAAVVERTPPVPCSRCRCSGVLNLGVLDLYRLTPGALIEAQLWDTVSAAAGSAGRVAMLSSSTEQAHLMELFQVQMSEGPCLDCFTPAGRSPRPT
jgi:hypothetical protein